MRPLRVSSFGVLGLLAGWPAGALHRHAPADDEVARQPAYTYTASDCVCGGSRDERPGPADAVVEGTTVEVGDSEQPVAVRVDRVLGARRGRPVPGAVLRSGPGRAVARGRRGLFVVHPGEIRAIETTDGCPETFPYPGPPALTEAILVEALLADDCHGALAARDERWAYRWNSGGCAVAPGHPGGSGGVLLALALLLARRRRQRAW